jgi:predicted RNA-binding Zn-ribbon protein involved in translation (DUF1610 family)
MIITMSEQLKCLRCGHEWTPRKVGRPAQCPNCKQTQWDRPSKWAEAPEPKRKLAVAGGRRRKKEEK